MISRLLPETIDVQLHTAPDLSPVLADSGSVEQMVLNLVTNARDAMPDGGTLEISLGTGDRDEAELSGHPGAEAGPYVWLAVADTGVGMDEETLAHAFEPFFTTKGPGMGTGLGLAVTYGLMEQHGGFVELWSEPGSGSRVKLYFPGLGGEIAEDAPEEADGRLPSGAGQTILVVEDEAPLRRTAQRVLERYGYRVLVADNGHSAMELVRQHRTDLALIISDVVMPRMGGIQLLAALQAEAIEVPVVLTSGYDGSPQEQAERVRRGNAFLLKPWSIQSLLVTVHDTLTLG
jgi:CheY-like chemotaxis protein